MGAGVACGGAAVSGASARAVVATAGVAAPLALVPAQPAAAVCVGGRPCARPRRRGLAGRSRGAGQRQRRRECGRGRRADRLAGAATGCARAAGDQGLRGRQAGRKPVRAGAGGERGGWCVAPHAAREAARVQGWQGRGWRAQCRHRDGCRTARRPTAGQGRARSHTVVRALGFGAGGWAGPAGVGRAAKPTSTKGRAPAGPRWRAVGRWGDLCPEVPLRPSPSSTA